MKTLFEFGEAVISIRSALNELTVKGDTNCGIIVFCNSKCDEIIAAINEACKTASPGDVEIDLDLNIKDDEKGEVKNANNSSNP